MVLDSGGGPQVLRDALMPKVIAMCLRTTSLVVRCAALGLMAQAVARLDKDAATAMLQVSGQVRSRECRQASIMLT
jgi:hypothetical protein